MAFIADEGRVSIGCQDAGTAEKLFGPGGLRNVFPHLLPAGWGGREAIGGSPRGTRLTRAQARGSAHAVAAMTPYLPSHLSDTGLDSQSSKTP